MTDLGRKVAATFKEIFYQYTNQTGRSAQKHLGPSEIGTPCDRQLAMKIMGMPAVNPGGDGWAAFVGTCLHVGLAEAFTWADARQGRFAVEQRLSLPSEEVPSGTADLLDRILYMLDDHKAFGFRSLDKLKRHGPSQTYRVQLHVYAYGARLRGEKIDHVALIAWPRDQPTLDSLYVWTEAYDPDIARKALRRVEVIAKAVADARERGGDDREIAACQPIDTSESCNYCPFYRQYAQDMTDGACNGR